MVFISHSPEVSLDHLKQQLTEVRIWV
jgi:hypothetical protein